MAAGSEQRANILFVKEVEKHPCLYNRNIPEYVRKDITEQAWTEIGKKFKLTGPESKEKWKNLRSVLLRRVRLRRRYGTDGKKPYYLSSFMRFAVPYMNMTREKKPGAQEPVSNDSSKLLDEEPDLSMSTEPIEDITNASPPQSPIDYVEFVPKPEERLSKNKKQRHKSEESKSEQVIAAYFKMKQSQTVQENEHSSNKKFLLSVLPDVDRMNVKQKRVFKRRLLDLVDDVLDEDSD